MNILGIETSCDETSIAIYCISSAFKKDRMFSKIESQINHHLPFGGVVPEIASRNHLIKLEPILNSLLKDAGLTLKDIDLIGVTNGPGLIGALFTGVAFAKAIAFALKIPVIGINHLFGHSISAELEYKNLKAPYYSLIISGGHTHLFEIDRAYNMRLLAKTIDDALGEAFDKVAKMLDLDYPGGPQIEELAKKGDPHRIKMPIALRNSPNFSFSGLKTFVKLLVNQNSYSAEDIAASFQYTVAETLADKIEINNRLHNIDKLVIAGGVASNRYIREYLLNKIKGIKLYIPSISLCTDNAQMIVYAAYKLRNKRIFLGLSSSAYDKLQNTLAY
ncbi:MAG: tRNA (adenosine(37)-N6)-threonylcarbamoyltransferase complex transferase subunit TsaD [Deferribacterota bacterium]|nr:tRNA (adenosine(37)-N6)-threonylcarbamoyltransferase complex transferase subunit TsaD [Deferribacterota bacterium]